MKKEVEEMSEEEILEEVAEYMASKHGDKHGGSFEEAKAQAKATMARLPPVHVKIMLEKARREAPPS